MTNARNRRWALGLLLLLLLTVTAACGQDGSEDADAAASGDSSGSGGDGGGVGLDPVRLALTGDFFGNQASWLSGKRFFSEVGFEEEAEAVFTDETIPSLLSGSVWTAQDETSVVFNALEARAGDLTIIGVIKDGEDWLLGHGPEIDGEEDIPGATISGGAAGDPWIAAGKIILEEEYGLDPENDVEWVSMGGGSDERAQAIVTGQLDLAMVQPRHIGTLEEIGGGILYNESREIANELLVVETSTLEENRESVCAYVEGRMRGHQWATEGEDNSENLDEIVEMVEAEGVEVTEEDIEGYPKQAGENWSADLGASAEAMNRAVSIFKDTGDLSEDFDWRDHSDFGCVHQVQEDLGLDKRPDPAEL